MKRIGFGIWHIELWRIMMITEHKKLLELVNNTPEILSLLYDVNLLPETTKEESLDYLRMMVIINLLHENIKAQELLKKIALDYLDNLDIETLKSIADFTENNNEA